MSNIQLTPGGVVHGNGGPATGCGRSRGARTVHTNQPITCKSKGCQTILTAQREAASAALLKEKVLSNLPLAREINARFRSGDVLDITADGVRREPYTFVDATTLYVYLEIAGGGSFKMTTPDFHEAMTAGEVTVAPEVETVVYFDGTPWQAFSRGGSVDLVAWFGLSRISLSMADYARMATDGTIRDIRTNCGTCGPRPAATCGWCFPCTPTGEQSGPSDIEARRIPTPLVIRIGSKHKSTSRNRRFRKGA